jgi:methyl-accepting chemotaxis protein
MARPRKNQMTDTSTDPVVSDTTEDTPSFVTQIEDAVEEAVSKVETVAEEISDAVEEAVSKVETVAEEISDFISEQTRAEIEMGRLAMKKLLGR